MVGVVQFGQCLREFFFAFVAAATYETYADEHGAVSFVHGQVECIVKQSGFLSGEMIEAA